MAARGFDRSDGVCPDPYDMQIQRDDLGAAVHWVAAQASAFRILEVSR